MLKTPIDRSTAEPLSESQIQKHFKELLRSSEKFNENAVLSANMREPLFQGIQQLLVCR
jgi:hypothetical protein